MIVGAGGKMGSTLAILAKRAADQAGKEIRIIAVSRFSNRDAQEALEHVEVETIACDLFDERAVQKLPDVHNIIYMVGMKFGSTGREEETWTINAFLPGIAAQKFRKSHFVMFSTGNVYPLTPVNSGGCKETDPVGPIGEYAQSALGRERIFTYFCRKLNIQSVIIRLNYAIDLRYGVLLDVAQKVLKKQPINLAMGHVNVLWQGEANAIALRAFDYVKIPPFVLNVTGPDIISIRDLGKKFGELFGVDPIFAGEATKTALLSNASLCHSLLGYPDITLEQMIQWTAHWLKISGLTLEKPTHFETRTGKF